MSEIVKKFIADRFGEKEGTSVNPGNIGAVSYTHLDVYKRQV